MAVSIDAVHYCVKARGVRDATSAHHHHFAGRPVFKSSQNTRRSSCAPCVTTTNQTGQGPPWAKRRIDFVRGVAILGILLL